jgi:CheY-like chemotaxis protein
MRLGDVMKSGEPNRGTVLIVDDNDGVREALTELLELEGYTVFGAANGKEALDQLQRLPPPCVILLDLRMPVMDGREFRREQQKVAALAAIPVFLLSADADGGEIAAALGVAGFFPKPADVWPLLQALASCCR